MTLQCLVTRKRLVCIHLQGFNLEYREKADLESQTAAAASAPDLDFTGIMSEMNASAWNADDLDWSGPSVNVPPVLQHSCSMDSSGDAVPTPSENTSTRELWGQAAVENELVNPVYGPETAASSGVRQMESLTLAQDSSSSLPSEASLVLPADDQVAASQEQETQVSAPKSKGKRRRFDFEELEKVNSVRGSSACIRCQVMKEPVSSPGANVKFQRLQLTLRSIVQRRHPSRPLRSMQGHRRQRTNMAVPVLQGPADIDDILPYWCVARAEIFKTTSVEKLITPQYPCDFPTAQKRRRSGTELISEEWMHSSHSPT